MTGEPALKGWKALQNKIGEDVEFYESRKRFDHDPRGLGAMLTVGVEISKLLDH